MGVAELKMLRVSLGVKRIDNIRNEYIRGTAQGSFRVRSTNGLRVTPPISIKFGTLADNAQTNSVQIFRDVGQAVSEI